MKSISTKNIIEGMIRPDVISTVPAVVLALFQPPHTIHIANVGDSKAYLFRNNNLHILTEDHSVTATMIREKIITIEDALHHPYQSHLTHSIGTNQNDFFFYDNIKLNDKDLLLLCSDGLWNMISNHDIINILKGNENSEIKCQQLINRANELGGNDNITTIIININNE